MALTATSMTERKKQYDQEGFWVEKGLLSPRAVKTILEMFVKLHDGGGKPGSYEFNRESTEPLERYPRVMQPHRFMPAIRDYLIDPRFLDILEGLVEEPVFACQSMFYFKPPQARGQAWHQDNYYLQVKPGTCVAAWIAIDPSDDENGGLQVIPQTHQNKVTCPEKADPATSFFGDIVHPPEGVEPVKLRLNPGDTLFFNGNVIHGSMPNYSKDRFRRSLIFHYAGQSCGEISGFYLPMLNRQGEEVARKVTQDGGPCGTTVSTYH